MPVRPWHVALYVAALSASVALWPGRVVGDGREYVVMAEHLSRLQPPSLTFDEARSHGLRDSRLDSRDGRHELPHFWLFPALCAPLVSIFREAGLPGSLAFAVVNVAVLGLAAAIAAAVLDITWWMFLLVSPVIWWTSAIHPDAFLYALLVAGFALAARGSPIAPVPLGLAAAQNPGLLPLVFIVSVYQALATDTRRFQLVACTAVALLIFAAHPAYYVPSLGRPTALLTTDGLRIPGVRLLTYIVADLNVGLVVQFPFLVVAMILVAVGASRRDTAAIALGVASTVMVLLAAAQVGNVNHGGTPGLSRYALWLAPPWIPAWSRTSFGRYLTRAPVALAACSGLWCLVFFNPSVPEDMLHSTQTAMFVWTRYAQLDNPLPQIFSERIRHALNVRPAATPKCEKALIYEGTWPEGCARTLVPEMCSRRESWCYANRTGQESYSFVMAFRDGKYTPLRVVLRRAITVIGRAG